MWLGSAHWHRFHGPSLAKLSYKSHALMLEQTACGAEFTMRSCGVAGPETFPSAATKENPWFRRLAFLEMTKTLGLPLHARRIPMQRGSHATVSPVLDTQTDHVASDTFNSYLCCSLRSPRCSAMECRKSAARALPHMLGSYSAHSLLELRGFSPVRRRLQIPQRVALP